MDGITASAIAIKVVHCDSVRTWPSGGGGRGVSKGAMRFSWVLVIVTDTNGAGGCFWRRDLVQPM